MQAIPIDPVSACVQTAAVQVDNLVQEGNFNWSNSNVKVWRGTVSGLPTGGCEDASL